MEKLCKTARVLQKITKLLRGLCIGFGIACAILLVIGIFLPDNLYSSFVNTADMSIHLGNVNLQLSRVIEPHGSLRLFVCTTLICAVVTLALSAFGLHLLYNILTSMAEARPFDGSVSRDLRKLGWVSLADVILYSLLSTAAAVLEIALFDLNELFAPGLVTGYTVENGIELSMLLIPAFLFLLSYVFQYGEELQKLSDETL